MFHKVCWQFTTWNTCIGIRKKSLNIHEHPLNMHTLTKRKKGKGVGRKLCCKSTQNVKLSNHTILIIILNANKKHQL